MDEVFINTMKKDLKQFGQKGTEQTPATAWIRSNTMSRLDFLKAAKAHHMSIAEFQDYVDQFRTLYQ